MVKKIIASICLVALLVGIIPVIPLQAKAADLSSVNEAYQVGYAKVDLNPYVIEDDPSSGIMALPLRGYGDNWNRLSTDGLLNDNGDDRIDENDGISATCIAISDAQGNAVLLYSVDFLSGDISRKALPVIVERVNAALESGELTGLQPLTSNQIQMVGTHTHSSIAAMSYSSVGKTGTNDDGVDLSVVNENLGIWLDRTNIDLADAAIAALKDRSVAQITKDQLSVSDATSDVIYGKRMNSTRHYNMDVDGDKFVGGNGFNAVDKWDYENPDDYRMK